MENHTVLPIPPPVTIAGLRQHFRVTYQLGDEQVELMVRSSRKSLDKILDEAEKALQSGDICARLGGVGHSLKGLLLNMGEPRWADLARDLEKSAKAGKMRDYAAIIDILTEGMAAVITYGDKAE